MFVILHAMELPFNRRLRFKLPAGPVAARRAFGLGLCSRWLVTFLATTSTLATLPAAFRLTRLPHVKSFFELGSKADTNTQGVLKKIMCGCGYKQLRYFLL